MKTPEPPLNGRPESGNGLPMRSQFCDSIATVGGYARGSKTLVPYRCVAMLRDSPEHFVP